MAGISWTGSLEVVAEKLGAVDRTTDDIAAHCRFVGFCLEEEAARMVVPAGGCAVGCLPQFGGADLAQMEFVAAFSNEFGPHRMLPV
ncbi:hypothetical protein ACLOJK_034384 [Asimina triloba]